MTFVLSFVAILAVFFALAVFFWIWWLAPRSQVPPHLTSEELRRLEVEDRLRQTNFQILTALGLGVTFLATVFQLTLTSRQWSEDYQLKTTQDRLGRYADALKSLDSEKATPANVSGIGSLLNLALQDPANYHSQVNEVLSTLVRQRATESRVRRSGECQDDKSTAAVDPRTLKYERSEAVPEVQSAMSVFGHPKFASYRYRLKFLSGACEARSASRLDLTYLRLDHRYLDELDLSGKNFSCADLSQSHFRRTSFYQAVLHGTDFGGARIADFEIPGFPEDRIGDKLYEPEQYHGPPNEQYHGPPKWMLYRCWATDFRGADLTNANFQGAALGGADFTGANLTNVKFCRADVSRVNFTDVIPDEEELKKMLTGACVGPDRDPGSPEDFVDVAQPIKINKNGHVQHFNFKIPRCPLDKTCQ